MGNQDLLIRTRSKSPIHSPYTRRQSHAHDHPRIGRHEPIRPAAAMQGACRHTNHANTQAGMHKSFVEIGPFVRWHAAIFSSFTVEHDIRRDESTADESSAIKELLSSAAGVGGRNLTGLHVTATERLLESVSRFGERSNGRDRL